MRFGSGIQMDRLKFQSLASGSSGNCYFVGNASYGILIDAGIGSRTIRKCLRNIGLDFDKIWGVFVTHDHADHIRGVGSMGERFHIPVYSTRKVHEGIDRSYCVTHDLSACRRYVEKGETVKVGEMNVTAFPVSHDATDSVGYTVEYRGTRITFATDLGYAGSEVMEHMKRADYLVLEANYDERMLREGSYPYHLKQRIMASTGHLSNDQAGVCLAENYREQLKHVFLCHLSKENNLPELALQTIARHLENRQIVVERDLELTVLERLSPSMLYELQSDLQTERIQHVSSDMRQ